MRGDNEDMNTFGLQYCYSTFVQRLPQSGLMDDGDWVLLLD